MARERVTLVLVITLIVSGQIAKSSKLEIHYYDSSLESSNSQETTDFKYKPCMEDADCPFGEYCFKQILRHDYCANCTDCKAFRREVKEGTECATSDRQCGNCTQGWFGNYCEYSVEKVRELTLMPPVTDEVPVFQREDVSVYETRDGNHEKSLAFRWNKFGFVALGFVFCSIVGTAMIFASFKACEYCENKGLPHMHYSFKNKTQKVKKTQKLRNQSGVIALLEEQNRLLGSNAQANISTPLPHLPFTSSSNVSNPSFPHGYHSGDPGFRLSQMPHPQRSSRLT